MARRYAAALRGNLALLAGPYWVAANRRALLPAAAVPPPSAERVSLRVCVCAPPPPQSSASSSCGPSCTTSSRSAPTAWAASTPTCGAPMCAPTWPLPTSWWRCVRRYSCMYRTAARQLPVPHKRPGTAVVALPLPCPTQPPACCRLTTHTHTHTGAGQPGGRLRVDPRLPPPGAALPAAQEVPPHQVRGLPRRAVPGASSCSASLLRRRSRQPLQYLGQLLVAALPARLLFRFVILGPRLALSADTLPTPTPPCRCGIFLHSPFPSSEIFRTFPRREEVIRSMLNAGACPPSPAPLLCASCV